MIIVAIAMLWHGCTLPKKTGGVYGTETDFSTGETVKNTSVQLNQSGEDIRNWYDISIWERGVDVWMPTSPGRNCFSVFLRH